jgi:hypothetical protein
MPTTGQPVAQSAYQSIAMQKYSNAWTPMVRTANRYFGGPIAAQADAQVGTLGAPVQMPMGGGKRRLYIPVGGNCIQVTVTSGGAGYAVNDLITMQAINGGRPVVVKVTAAPAGVLSTVDFIDPGSGLVAGGSGVNVISSTWITLVQASTTGAGAGATFVGPAKGALPCTGWTYPVPNPNA